MSDEKSDTALTGKTYPKLNAYGGGKYLGSSIQFKTMYKFKRHMEYVYPDVKITIEKDKR